MVHAMAVTAFLLLGAGALLAIFHSIDESLAQIRIALAGARAVRVTPPAPRLAPTIRPMLRPAPVAAWRASTPLREAA